MLGESAAEQFGIEERMGFYKTPGGSIAVRRRRHGVDAVNAYKAARDDAK